MSKEIILHPVCEIFPKMSETEFQELKESIREHGLKTVITFWRGQLIDGRHRARALEELGISIDYHWAELEDDDDPIAFAIAANLHRRQLTTSQKSMVAAELATLQNGSNQYQKQGGEISPATLTIEQAAETVGVDRKSVVTAKAVQRDAAPEVVEAVKAGDLSLNAAKKLAEAEPDKAKQAEIVAKGKEHVREVVAAKKAEPKSEPPVALPAAKKAAERGSIAFAKRIRELAGADAKRVRKANTVMTYLMEASADERKAVMHLIAAIDGGGDVTVKALDAWLQENP